MSQRRSRAIVLGGVLAGLVGCGDQPAASPQVERADQAYGGTATSSSAAVVGRATYHGGGWFGVRYNPAQWPEGHYRGPPLAPDGIARESEFTSSSSHSVASGRGWHAINTPVEPAVTRGGFGSSGHRFSSHS